MGTSSRIFNLDLRVLPLNCSILLGISLIVFAVRLVQVRRRFRRLRQNDLPMPPHNFWLGHLLVCARILHSLPPDAHPFYLADQIRRQYPYLDTAFYLDLWPFNDSVLMVISPRAMADFTQNGYLPKHAITRRILEPLTGDQDLVSMDGPSWKHWRSLFKPGFSHKNVMSVVPQIVEEALVLEKLIAAQAEREDIFQLEALTRNFSFDVIGRVVMNHRFACQTNHNILTSAMKEQIEWCSVSVEHNLFQRLNPLRPIIHRLNKSRIDGYLSKYWRDRPSVCAPIGSGQSVIDLAISALTSQEKDPTANSGAQEGLETQIMCHIKTFLVAGHDTVATSICFVLHLLYSHRDVLQQTRDEHDAVFGRDVSQTAELLASQPQLLNRLSITLSVIRESLRLYPATSTARAGQADFEIVDEDGRSFPTKGLLVWGNHHGLHYNPRFWPEPEKFLPERWRVSEEHALYPPKDAWRPFEKGPRACLGQALAMTEMLVVIVLLLRKYNITSAYSEWDSLQLRSTGRGILGQRLYQCLRGEGYPSDHYPCTATKNI